MSDSRRYVTRKKLKRGDRLRVDGWWTPGMKEIAVVVRKCGFHRGWHEYEVELYA